MPSISRRDAFLGAIGLALPSLLIASSARADVMAQKDTLLFVHPQLRAAARRMLLLSAKAPPLSLSTLPTMRAPNSWYGPPIKQVPYRKVQIQRPQGSLPLTVYVINAKPGTVRPAIVHMHGGGFVGGSAADGIRELQDIASKLDCCIVTVDYRLAPEARYDRSIEDNYSALRWLNANAEALGADVARIAVMGESAGGGHAALLAITARDRGEFPIAFQCLTYPMLDDKTGSSRKVAAPIGTLVWTADANRFGWRSFLGEEPGGSAVPTRAVPARTTSMKGLPAAWIGVGSIDLFVEEDIEYARRLISADVMTELLVTPGAFHGFNGLAPAEPIAREFNAARLSALSRALLPEALTVS